ncbi:hypothetical protein [uncultured Mediterranean phage uvMED]|nr:hypothetical protein [uncultured Mediterranean phage uvMED]
MEILIIILGGSSMILVFYCARYYDDLKRTERILKYRNAYIKHLEDEQRTTNRPA